MKLERISLDGPFEGIALGYVEWGPPEAEAFIARDGGSWRRP